MTVRTDRLVLRPWAEADRERFAAMNADPRVMQYFPTLLSRSESDAFVDRIEAHWAEHGFGLWAVDVEHAFAGFVGLATVTFEADFTPAVEIGWRLDHAYWGRGLASQGARAALAYGFTELALTEVVSFTAVLNERSWRVMERIGMARAGAFEHPRVPAGSPLRPHLLYRTDVDDWRARPADPRYSPVSERKNELPWVSWTTTQTTTPG